MFATMDLLILLILCVDSISSLNFNLKSISTLSLGFRVGNFRDSGPFNIIYSIWNKNIDFNSGFRVGKFCASGSLDVVYLVFFLNFNFKLNNNLNWRFWVRKFCINGPLDILIFSSILLMNKIINFSLECTNKKIRNNGPLNIMQDFFSKF